MVLRELIASFGFRFDPEGFDKADQALKNTGKVAEAAGKKIASSADLIRSVFGALGIGLGVGAALEGIRRTINAASDANETLNVMNETFMESTPIVKEWASTFAREVGRSEYELREMAGTLGAVLSPMLDGNAKAAAEMSMALVQLGVDLGSFYNAAEKDVLSALRSGIVGQSEPLLRFGVVMLESTLEAFRLAEGITKSYKAMTSAEKVQLRFQFIMKTTKNAQGDALRTADGWANATKGVSGALRDLITKLGGIFLPTLNIGLGVLRDWITKFNELTSTSKILQSALLVLSSWAVVYAARMLIAWWPTLLPFLKLAAIVALVILVIDDLWTTFEGGESVTRDLIDSIFGPGSATEAVNYLKDAFDGAALSWKENLKPAMEDFGGFVYDVFHGVISLFKNLQDSAYNFGDAVAQAMSQAKQAISDWINGLPGPVKYLLNLTGEGGIGEGIRKTMEGLGSSIYGAMEARDEQRGTPLYEKGYLTGAAPVLYGPTENASRQYSVYADQKINMSINAGPGAKPEDIGKQVADGVKQPLGSQTKDIVDALKRGK